MKKLLLLAGLALMVCSASAKKPAQKTQEEGYKFTDLTTVPTTSVKDQHRSGTCWCYSALSFLENEILRPAGRRWTCPKCGSSATCISIKALNTSACTDI